MCLLIFFTIFCGLFKLLTRDDPSAYNMNTGDSLVFPITLIVIGLIMTVLTSLYFGHYNAN